MRNHLQELSRFWMQEWTLSVLTLMVALQAFVVYPLVDLGWVGRTLTDLVLSGLLLSGVAVVGKRKIYILLVGVTVGLSLVVHWSSVVVPSLVLQAVDRLLVITSLLILAGVVLKRVFSSGPVNFYRIQGAVCAYLLLGLAWAAAYALVELVHPGSIQFAPSGPGLADYRSTVLYFSFTTLTTVGFGDTVPLHPVARSLATMEALTGQLYPAILIANLVSRQLLAQRERSK